MGLQFVRNIDRELRCLELGARPRSDDEVHDGRSDYTREASGVCLTVLREIESHRRKWILFSIGERENKFVVRIVTGL